MDIDTQNDSVFNASAFKYGYFISSLDIYDQFQEGTSFSDGCHLRSEQSMIHTQ